MSRLDWERARARERVRREPPQREPQPFDPRVDHVCATCHRPIAPDARAVRRRSDGKWVHGGGCPRRDRGVR